MKDYNIINKKINLPVAIRRKGDYFFKLTNSSLTKFSAQWQASYFGSFAEKDLTCVDCQAERLESEKPGRSDGLPSLG